MLRGLATPDSESKLAVRVERKQHGQSKKYCHARLLHPTCGARECTPLHKQPQKDTRRQMTAKLRQHTSAM
eukprot:14340975-Alexandrium_andersonii.AAC.1